MRQLITLLVALALVGCSALGSMAPGPEEAHPAPVAETPAHTGATADSGDSIPVEPALVPGTPAVPGRDLDLNALWNAMPRDLQAFGIRRVWYVAPDRFLVQQQHGAGAAFLYFLYRRSADTVYRLTTLQHHLTYEQVKDGRLYFLSQGPAASALLAFPYRLAVTLPASDSQTQDPLSSEEEPLWLHLGQRVTIGHPNPRTLQAIEGDGGALRLRFGWPPGAVRAGGDYPPRLTLNGGPGPTLTITMEATTAAAAVLGQYPVAGVPGVRSVQVERAEGFIPAVRITLDLETGIRSYSARAGGPAVDGATIDIRFSQGAGERVRWWHEQASASVPQVGQRG